MAGVQGPWIILVEASMNEKLPNIKKLQELHGALLGSLVVKMPSVYMTDETLHSIAPKLAKGLWYFPMVKDNANWWVVMMLDGYGSHINVQEQKNVELSMGKNCEGEIVSFCACLCML